MVAESWFRTLWKVPRKHDANAEMVVVEVLAFEVASLMMSKLVNLWQTLSDKQIAKLREEITNSIGIRKLVSEDDHFIERLICAVRTALRAKLKPYTKSMSTSSLVYDTSLAKVWNEAMTNILEWLAPLAHNMIRWQSERSFEQQSFVSRTNVLLVQTLYFADQEKTEEAITELLVGLNYVWRYARELNAKALAECVSFRVDNEYPNLGG